MQYLSKAYNYYSGINPATLSGAIDVIVVRHVDAEGEVTLSSSPFHVRFGKLQVLRAGEKRVTLRLPNNLPAPHTAPFSMKVGDTGEAFFVLETDEEVPSELLTSPVVQPTEASPHIHPSTTPGGTSLPHPPETGKIGESSGANALGGSLTQEPFGQTEQLKDDSDEEPLAEVEYLDLNASSPPESSRIDETDPDAGDAASPSTLLNTATSFLPSIPFLSGRSSPNGDETPQPPRRRSDPQPNTSTTKTPSNGDVLPPNPIEAKEGDRPELPERDEKLEDVKERNTGPHDKTTDGSVPLPKVAAGSGDGPQVIYGKDVVLDMAGYHSEKQASTPTEADPPPLVQASRLQSLDQTTHDALIESLARDLLAALQADEVRPALPLRSTEPEITQLAPGASLPTSSQPDLLRTPSDDAEIRSRRGDRATTEPPPDLSPSDTETPQTETVPNGATAAIDYAWDWGRIPSSGHRVPERSDSLPLPALELPPSESIKPADKNTARLKNVEENPYLFVLDIQGRTHAFELALCEEPTENAFVANRITFQRFIEDPELVDDPRLVMRYSLQFLSWATHYNILYSLAMYRRTLSPPIATSPVLPPLSDLGVGNVAPRPVSGYGWSRWMRRAPQFIESKPPAPPAAPEPASAPAAAEPQTHFAKTLRLSSDQLKMLNLKPGPNTIQFSVTSSYSGLATCSARIFLWEETDQVVISDIDGTITKSDALGHVFAAIGRDWTHLGIAKLYTDIANNGYKMLYLTSRAIGQADTTREYLKTIVQGDYRLPEGPVIMSPDRLMASLHREVIMRKPELFKMACLRDIQRLFGSQAKESFFAGFGNRITDAMSYRSVGIIAAKIYTIDSTGVVKTELLQAAGHKGSYIQLNDLVNEVFPPVKTKFKPEFTDFNYWRPAVADIPLPDLSPPSPALSARSDTSGRLSVLGKIAGLGRKSSKQPVLPIANSSASSRPSSPLMGASSTSDDMSDGEDDRSHSRASSMPGSFEEPGSYFPASRFSRGDTEEDLEQGRRRTDNDGEDTGGEDEGGDNYDDDEPEDNFDDDLLATGEMRNVPF